MLLQLPVLSLAHRLRMHESSLYPHHYTSPGGDLRTFFPFVPVDRNALSFWPSDSAKKHRTVKVTVGWSRS
jgi:hypothetical protein